MTCDRSGRLPKRSVGNEVVFKKLFWLERLGQPPLLVHQAALLVQHAEAFTVVMTVRTGIALAACGAVKGLYWREQSFFFEDAHGLPGRRILALQTLFVSVQIIFLRFLAMLSMQSISKVNFLSLARIQLVVHGWQKYVQTPSFSSLKLSVGTHSQARPRRCLVHPLALLVFLACYFRHQSALGKLPLVHASLLQLIA